MDEFRPIHARGREGPIRPRSRPGGPPLARQPRDRGVVHGHRPGDGTAAFAGLEALEGLGLLMPVSLGCGRSGCPWPWRQRRPSLARLRMRPRSSSAIADRKAMKPRPIGVVRSRCGLSSTLISAPRSLMRLIRFDAVEHRAGCPVPFGDDQHVADAELVDRLSSSGRFLTLLPQAFSRKITSTALGAKRADLAIEVLMRAADPAVADFAHLISYPDLLTSKRSVWRLFCNGSTLINSCDRLTHQHARGA